MNQSINTDSKNSKEPQQKYRLGTVSIKILGGLNRFYRRLTQVTFSRMIGQRLYLIHWIYWTLKGAISAIFWSNTS